MECSTDLTSEKIFDVIVASDETGVVELQPVCKYPINEKYAIWYYNTDQVPMPTIARYSYGAIPKCFGLLDTTSLEVSGIIRMQNIPTLSLTGQGVLIAVIDTGIAYTDSAFRNIDGSTRILSIWDQTAPYEGAKEIPFGQIYTREQINEALRQENPADILPEVDEEGHGTAMASIVAGSADPASDFTGAAPDADLVVVKLKQAKQNLRQIFFVPQTTNAYAESDIMAGIAYVNRIAEERNMPLVIMLGLGSNNGSHAGTSPLCDYLDILGGLRHRAIVIAAGNEANMRHHFLGNVQSVLTPQKVEINVERDMDGFYVELWALAPERFSVSVQSPTGEITPRVQAVNGVNQTVEFLFEGTELSIDYRDAGIRRRNQLIFLRFSNAVRGIWTVNVFTDHAITGNYHMWLPMKGMLQSPVYFINSNPDTTITSPSDAGVPMTVGGYNAQTGALYLDSGRGFDSTGAVKPDYVAPAVEVTAKGLRNDYITTTGTSAGAAIAAGACAQILEWAVVRESALGINTVDIKNFLIRGANRTEGSTYPSTEMGYGKLDVYRAFELLRNVTV